VIEEDSLWDTEKEVACKCGGKHKIYPSKWLAVIKNKAWISKNQPLTVENLFSLLDREGRKDWLLSVCREDKPSKLLRKLGISITNLIMQAITTDEHTRAELDYTIGSLLSTFSLSEFLEFATEKLRVDRLVKTNQRLGKSVEDVLRRMLLGEGLKVTRTAVGSDFEVEHDFIEGNEEQILEIEKQEEKIYLEIKATNQDYVKMTPTQARTARNCTKEPGKYGQYVLCVVKYDGQEITEENVKNNARFIMDIGQIIRDKIDKVDELENQQKTVTEPGDIEIEVSGGSIRLKIHKKIWDKGKTFEEFLNSIIGRSITSTTLNPPRSLGERISTSAFKSTWKESGEGGSGISSSENLEQAPS
jgi:hypothetical protein